MAALTNINTKHLKGLSQFNNIKEFNDSNEKWLADNKRKFTYSEYFAVKRLIRFAGNKVLGVANACINTILKVIKKYDAKRVNGISRSTFKRAINKAISIGMINVYDGKRWNGSKTANVYVFEPYKTLNCHDIEPCPKLANEVVQPSEHEVASRVEEEVRIIKSLNHLKASKKSKAINNINTTYSNENVVSKVSLYQNMKNLLKSTTGTTKLASRLFGVYKASTSKLFQFDVYKADREHLETIGYQSLRITIQASKTKNIKNMPGFYSGVLNNLLDKFVLEGIQVESEELEILEQDDLNDMQRLFFNMIS